MSFLSNFVEGFSGSGMFLGPPQREQSPLLEPDVVIPDPERLYLDLNHLFNADEETITPSQKGSGRGRGSENHSQSWSSQGADGEQWHLQVDVLCLPLLS